MSFGVYNGSADPAIAQTRHGAASTSIVLYSDAYSSRPNVEVRSGDMETAIRVRCIPNSGCPLSPPPNASPPCGPTPFPCNPSPGAGLMSPPCAFVPPPSPPICAPNQTSPPCVPPSPPPCDPNVPSPPCAPVSPPPGPTSIGGQIYIGAPELIGGKIRVPVNTTSAQDRFSGFNVSLVFDGTFASVANLNTDVAIGSAFEALGGGTFCVRATPPSPSPSMEVVFGCVALDLSNGGTSGPGTLAYISLTPKSNSCLTLHLVTYGLPDNGYATEGTFTIDSHGSAAQSNTYGPDVYVNTADGSDCGSTTGIGSCIDFSNPAGCGVTATPTPAGTPTPMPTATFATVSDGIATTSTATLRQRRR